jgi:hypothetical protein
VSLDFLLLSQFRLLRPSNRQKFNNHGHKWNFLDCQRTIDLTISKIKEMAAVIAFFDDLTIEVRKLGVEDMFCREQEE